MNITFEDIAALKKNWNGYDADPISIATLTRVKEFYEESGIKPNFMAPTARDTIQFECQDNLNYVEIEIYPRSFHIYIVDDKENWSYEGHFHYNSKYYEKVRKIIEFFSMT